MAEQRGTTGWRIGAIGGVPVILTWSWAIVALLLAYLYYNGFSHTMAPRREVFALVMALGLVLVLFLAVFLHELAHGLVGRAFGMQPREYVMTFFGGHTSFSSAGSSPISRAMTSLAGPAANLLLAGGCWLTAYIINPPGFGFFGPFGGGGWLPAGSSLGLLWLFYAGLSNWLIGLFNLIPAAPLDGGGLVEALVWKLSGRRNTGLIASGWCGLVFAGVLLVWALVLGRGQAGFDGVIWWVLIAVVVGQGAALALRQGRAFARYESFSVMQLAEPAMGLENRYTVGQAATRLADHPAWWVVVLDSAGAPEGLISPSDLARVPDSQASQLTLDAVMQVIPRGWAVEASAKGLEALAGLVRPADQVGHLPVVESGRVVGVLDMAKVRRLAGRR
ncbi:MAG: hypothetical protein FWG16_04755 [Micrococcales bacterium]|nr:hypothetical protein [Micrococcales bacterium]